MKKTDLVAGARHTVYAYGREVGFLLGYTLFVLLTVLIVGASLWVPGVCLILTVIRVVSTVCTCARNNAEAREFYDFWLSNNPEAASADD